MCFPSVYVYFPTAVFGAVFCVVCEDKYTVTITLNNWTKTSLIQNSSNIGAFQSLVAFYFLIQGTKEKKARANGTVWKSEESLVQFDRLSEQQRLS